MDVRIEKMLKKKNIYALMLSSALAVVLTGCSKQVILADDGGKTAVEVSVDMPLAADARTKAYDATFEKDDRIWTYLQHVNLVEAVDVEVSGFSRLCQIDVNSTSSTASNAINNWDGPNYKLVTTNMYWDDFMSGDDGKDIRDTGHGLRSFYALCYNGGTPSTVLADATGVLGWSVAANQSSGIKTSDLLYSGTQAKVAYQHSITSALNGQHGVIHLPFNHAMSKITIEVEGDESFNNSASIFDATQIILQDVNTVCTVTTPTQALSAYGKGSGDGKVTMQPVSPFFAKRRSFTAVIAPSLIKGGDAVFAKLMNVGGYNFELKLSDAVINPVDGESKPIAGSWAGKLATYNATEVTPSTAKGYTAENGGLTIPGVNYYIKVTVHRQGIEVSAQIQPWETVNAAGTATALFEGDIKTTGEIVDDLQAGGFDMYASTNPASFGSVASTVTWVDEEEPTPDHWQYSPQLYWPSGTYNSYFRALSPSRATTTLTSHDKPVGQDNQDVLWGTTSAHEGTDESGNSYNFAEGDPIRPRTGKVPMTFYHAMAKITVNLVDAHASDPAASEPLADPHLDLRGATLALQNLAVTGTIDLNNGSVTPATPSELLTGYYAANDESTLPDGAKKVKDYFVVPQSMKAAEDPSVADPYLEITLADGTTKYKIYLRNVLVQKAEGDPEYVDSWERNKHYEYTITLSKEEITFRALVKDWDVKNGSGLADLEWD